MGYRAYIPNLKAIGRYFKMGGLWGERDFPPRRGGEGIFGVAQYPNRFKICLSTTVPNFVPVSQDAQ